MHSVLRHHFTTQARKEQYTECDFELKNNISHSFLPFLKNPFTLNKSQTFTNQFKKLFILNNLKLFELKLVKNYVMLGTPYQVT